VYLCVTYGGQMSTVETMLCYCGTVVPKWDKCRACLRMAIPDIPMEKATTMTRDPSQPGPTPTVEAWRCQATYTISEAANPHRGFHRCGLNVGHTCPHVAYDRESGASIVKWTP
jgi:hypothetical protein